MASFGDDPALEHAQTKFRQGMQICVRGRVRTYTVIAVRRSAFGRLWIDFACPSPWNPDAKDSAPLDDVIIAPPPVSDLVAKEKALLDADPANRRRDEIFRHITRREVES